MNLLVGVSVRALAESAVRSGYPVIALDAFGDADLLSLCEGYSLRRDFHLSFSARHLFKASQNLQFDGVSYTSNLENYPSVVRDFARRAKILGNTPEVLTRVRNWPELYQALKRDGFRAPLTAYSLEEIPEGFQGRWLQKPVRGGSGRLVSFWDPGKKMKRGCLLQEYIEGVNGSASFIANGREAVVIGVTEQLIGQPGVQTHIFQYRGNLLPLESAAAATSAPDILDQVKRIASLLTREFGLVGFNGFDFILNQGEVCLIEVNPRYGASMEVIERAYHLPVFDFHFQAVTRGRLPDFDIQNPGVPANQFMAKSILYAIQDGRAPDTSRWFAQGARDIPHAGEDIHKGQPVCTLFARGQSRPECLANLSNEVDRYNKDIYG